MGPQIVRDHNLSWGPTTTTVTTTTMSATTDTIDLIYPFGSLEGVTHNDIRETAYEIFFTSCRSSPGFGGRNNISFYSQNHHNDAGNDNGGGVHGTGSGNNINLSFGGRGGNGSVVVTTPISKIKRALGLKMIKKSPSRRMSSGGGGGGGGGGNAGSPGGQQGGGISSPSHGVTTTGTLASRPRRPLTSAEIMRIQMKVTEQSDNRLRKTLMRSLVGQAGKRAETIILPLELLRHLKPSEFADSQDYHLWQRRQLRILEAGLLLHPSIPLDRTNTYVMRLREIVHSSETKPIDTSKNSDTMRTLSNCVVSLAWRSPNGTPTDVCHWADGFPLNVQLYLALLQSVFDYRDETLILDEVDELVELMKKTWSTLGINKSTHNLCFTWVLFQQYVVTNQSEPDLLCAAHAMLSTEVANDSKKSDREAFYVKLLSSMLVSMQGWAEKRLHHYHDHFQRGTAIMIENLLPLALSAAKISGDDLSVIDIPGQDKGDAKVVDSNGSRIDHYIRVSVKNAFAKIIETGQYKSMNLGGEDEASEALVQLAKETEDLALRERECFSPVLKRWNSVAASIASVTLHQCYGAILKQYLSGVSTIRGDTVEVLKAAEKLEKMLIQMVVEDSTDCEDGGKSIVNEMLPYEVDSIIARLMSNWLETRLVAGRNCVVRAKDSETWNPKSKNEPYAQTGVELVRIAKDTVQEFFQIPITITDDLVFVLTKGLDKLFLEYISFVATCGSKQSYLPVLPPLTRCNRDSRFRKLWQMAAPCATHSEGHSVIHGVNNTQEPKPSTSRGTQRLYIRLNTLQYLLTHLHSLDKALTLAPQTTQTQGRLNKQSNYFEPSMTAIQSACKQVSEVAAYRLVFLDSNSVFYESLYAGDVTNKRINPALRILILNINLLTSIVVDRAQPLALKEVMKATFESFLMVLLAGGGLRVFYRSDQQMIEEDFESLKRIFCTCGEGLINEQTVENEAEIVEGVIGLMGEYSEKLIEDFSIITCETSGIGVLTTGQKLPMPPTTGRWNKSDPNTILRVLCHRNDNAANQFLKNTFQLAKRR